MTCPSCDSEDFGTMERDGKVVRGCSDCGYIEEATFSEVALHWYGDGAGGWTEAEEPTGANEGEQ